MPDHPTVYWLIEAEGYPSSSWKFGFYDQKGAERKYRKVHGLKGKKIKLHVRRCFCDIAGCDEVATVRVGPYGNAGRAGVREGTDPSKTYFCEKHHLRVTRNDKLRILHLEDGLDRLEKEFEERMEALEDRLWEGIYDIEGCVGRN